MQYEMVGGKMKPLDEVVIAPGIAVTDGLSAKLKLSEKVKEAWAEPELRRLRVSLKKAGQETVKPVYRRLAKEIQLSDRMRKTAEENKIDLIYEGIWV